MCSITVYGDSPATWYSHDELFICICKSAYSAVKAPVSMAGSGGVCGHRVSNFALYLQGPRQGRVKCRRIPKLHLHWQNVVSHLR
jgi:hypothetical protein